jgi:hypothetical protein
MFMRHWLAGVLARERPVLFRALPESFKVGLELPQKPLGGAAVPPYQKAKDGRADLPVSQDIAARCPYQTAFRPRLRIFNGLSYDGG